MRIIEGGIKKSPHPEEAARAAVSKDATIPFQRDTR